MYPNLYYVFKDFFGVDWKILQIFNSFGFFVAIAFILCWLVLAAELKRKSKQGLLTPTEETVEIGKPVTAADLVLSFITGFLIAYKFIGLIIAVRSGAVLNPQDYVFSSQGSWWAGFLGGALMTFFKWKDKRRHKLTKPETRVIRVWPYDRVGEITMIAVVFGLLGAKLFDAFENWDSFVKDPASIFSGAGLTFYGGLICAGIALWWYTRRHKIPFLHFTDAIGPVMMLGYALGRIGCQVSGDGDWGIYNAAYKTTDQGGILPATANDFNAALTQHAQFFTNHTSHHTFFPRPQALSFLPDWFFAYDFPHNVNEEGVQLAGCIGKYCSHLPIPVFPTSLYETILCLALFGVLWLLRKRIAVPGMLFSIYLILNGLERFFIEKIRVNVKMHFLGMEMTQAELISFSLIILGVVLFFLTGNWYRRRQVAAENK